LAGAALVWVAPEKVDDKVRTIWDELKKLEPDTPEVQAKFSAVGVRLDKLKARERLQKMDREDTSDEARTKAAYTLKRVAMVDEATKKAAK
jgi:hypothetical protein